VTGERDAQRAVGQGSGAALAWCADTDDDHLYVSSHTVATHPGLAESVTGVMISSRAARRARATPW